MTHGDALEIVVEDVAVKAAPTSHLLLIEMALPGR